MTNERSNTVHLPLEDPLREPGVAQSRAHIDFLSKLGEEADTKQNSKNSTSSLAPAPPSTPDLQWSMTDEDRDISTNAVRTDIPRKLPDIVLQCQARIAVLSQLGPTKTRNRYITSCTAGTPPSVPAPPPSATPTEPTTIGRSSDNPYFTSSDTVRRAIPLDEPLKDFSLFSKLGEELDTKQNSKNFTSSPAPAPPFTMPDSESSRTDEARDFSPTQVHRNPST